MDMLLKIFSNIFYFFLGLAFLVVCGYVLMVTLYLSISWMVQTSWWKGVMATHGDVVMGVLICSIVFFGLLFLNWMFKD